MMLNKKNNLLIKIFSFSSLFFFLITLFFPGNVLAFGFKPKVDYTAFNNPYQVITADFNKDSHLDLVTANSGSNNISILLGNGDGTFGTATHYTAGNAPYSVTAADFNEDSNLDLAVANYGENFFSILLGNGDGTFAAPSNFSVGSSQNFIISGNFKEPLHADLQIAMTTAEKIYQRFGDGYGDFTVGGALSPGSDSLSIATGDFNGDGHTDVVAPNSVSHKVVVFLGVGNGTFSAGVNYSTTGSPVSVAVGNFNADSYQDLAVANQNNISILLGNGDGTFGTATDYSAGSCPNSVAVADFNKDSKNDLVVVNYLGNNLSVLLGNGDGTFGTATNYSAGSSPVSVTTGDFNEDTYPDFVVANSGVASVSVILTDPSTPPAGTSAVLQNSAPTTVDMVVTGSDFNTFVNSGTTTAGASDLANITYNSTHPTSAVINNSTTMTLTFGIATGTGKSGGSLTIAADTVQDGSSTHNSLITITDGNITDNATPQYISSTTLDNNNDSTADYVKVVYSEAVLDSTVSASDFEAGVTNTSNLHLLESFSSGTPSSGNDIDVVNDNTVYIGIVSGDETISSSKTDYTIKIQQYGAITDYEGHNALASFSEKTSSDGARPFVIDVSPLNGSTNQSISSHIIIHFTEPIYDATFDVTNIIAGSSFDWYDGNKTYEEWHGGGKVFSTGTTYIPTLSASTTKDLNNNFIVSDYSWSFTTTGSGASSAVLQNSTSTTVDMVVTGTNFSTFVGSGTTTAGAGDLANITYNSTHPTSAVINNSTTMTLTFGIATGTGKSGGSLTIAADTVQDGSSTHNSLITITDGNITDNAKPVVRTISPVNGSTDQSRTSDIIITFSEPMTTGSLAFSTSPSLSYTPVWSNGNKTVNLSHSSFADSTSYTATIGTGTTDAASSPNALASQYQWSFTTIATGPAVRDIDYSTVVNYSVGTSPLSITSGLFNSDSYPDLAVANWGSENISILLGNDDGTFGNARNISVGSSASFVTSGLFNSDSYPDLVVVRAGNIVSILLGNGDGTFGTPSNYSVGSFSVTSGLFNSDSYPDLAVANSSINKASILLGNGDGTFGTATNYTIGSEPRYIISGLFNSDSYPDLAVANESDDNVSILLGNGDGTFQAAVNYSTGISPRSITSGLFNSDSYLDIAVTAWGNEKVSILLGNGDGTFGTALNYSAGSYPYSINSGLFNTDSYLDLAVANYGSDNISILLGNGEGTFEAATNYSVGTGPSSITSGLFNNDSYPDLAVANSGSNNISILLAHPLGTPPTASSAVLQNSTSTTVDMVVTGTDFSTFVNSGTTTAGAGDLANITYNSTHPTSAVINNSTTMTLTFGIATGTGKSGGSLTIAADTVQDGSSTHNALITIVNGSITDSAKPVLNAASLVNSPAYTAVGFTYSEPITITTGASTTARGDITTAGTVAGFGSFATTGDVTVPTGKNYIDLPFPSTVFLYLAYMPGGYLNSTSTTEPSGVFTPVASAEIVDAAGNQVDPAITRTLSEGGNWTLTKPTISSIAVSDPDHDGRISRAVLVFSRSMKDNNFSNGDASLGSSGTTSGTFTTGIANDSTLTFNRTTDDNAIDTSVSGSAGDFTYSGSTTLITDVFGNLLDTTTPGIIISGDKSEVDGATPVVTSTVPVDSSTGQSTTDDIVVNFSEAMTTGSLAFSTSPSLSYTPAWSNGNKTVNLSHASFANSTLYTATIGTGTTDAASSPNAIASQYQWSFTTGATGNLSISGVDEISINMTNITATAVCSGGTPVSGTDVAGTVTLLESDLTTTGSCSDGDTVTITISKDGYVTSSATQVYLTGISNTKLFTNVKYALKVTVVNSSLQSISGATVSAGLGGTSCVEDSGSGIYYCAVPVSDSGTTISVSKSGYNAGTGSYIDRTLGTDEQSVSTVTMSLSDGGSTSTVGGSGSIVFTIQQPLLNPKRIINGCISNEGYSSITGESCANAFIVIDQQEKTSPNFEDLDIKVSASGPFDRLVFYWENSKSVKDIQEFLNSHGYFSAKIDGIFGPNTYLAVKKFQIANNIIATGSVGPLTLNKLNEIYSSEYDSSKLANNNITKTNSNPVISKGVDISSMKTIGPFTKVIVYWEKSKDVKDIQNFLKENGYFSGTVDGLYGPNTYTAIRKFQIANNIRVTGAIGPLTLDKLNEISNRN